MKKLTPRRPAEPQPNLDECLIRIRLHKERDDAYVAHCLELDLVAVDKQPWRAVEKCAMLINGQIEFARRNHNEAYIWFPAPQEYEAPQEDKPE